MADTAETTILQQRHHLLSEHLRALINYHHIERVQQDLERELIRGTRRITHHNGKLSDQEKDELIHLYTQGWTYTQLAKRYDIKKSSVGSLIKTRRRQGLL